MQSERDSKQKGISIDWITLLLVFALVAFGILTIANVMAEPFTGDEIGFAGIRAKINLEYVQRQAVNFIVAFAAMLVMIVIDYNLYKMVIKYVYVANTLLLIMLLVLAESTRGVMGWFNLGVRAFQPSELFKVTLIITLSNIAANIVEKEGAIKSFKGLLMVGAYFIGPFLLVLLQPDYGTAIVFFAILVCILFISKLSWKFVLGALVFVAGMMPLSYFYLFSDTQRERIDVFLNPDLADPKGAGLHVLRSKEAIGSGQLYGKGYFSQGTLAQLKYVPERHTDFIFSGIAEGFGFVGGAALIVVYFLLIFRWMWVALHAKDHFGTCLVVGSIGMMIAHVFENIGMTIGLMPVTGIPLPFVSYGGSNLLTNMMVVGIVLNVWMRRQVKR